MKCDKEIIETVEEIQILAYQFLGYAKNANQCAYTDVIIEQILEKAEILKSIYNT